MQDYVVIDLEMTGLNAKTDHILEVGAVRVRNHQAVDKFGAILCQNVKIPEKVTELTGITEAMVQGGMEKEEAMRDRKSTRLNSSHPSSSRMPSSA